MRQNKPWFRASKGAYYCELNGKQYRLAKGRENHAAAMTAFYKLMATEGAKPPAADAILVVQVCDLFLQWSEKHNEPTTFTGNKHFLTSFTDHPGIARLKVVELKPFHVTRWLDAHPSWNGARRSAIGIVKRAFSWADDEGLIEASSIRKIKKPPVNRRERVLTAAERKEIFGAIRDQRFRDFVFAMQETGCRPGEVARVTGAQVDLDSGVWVFAKHKTKKKTARSRVVYLTPAMVDLTRRLLAENPQGPLFRGWAGRPYSKNSIRCRFRRLRTKLPHLGNFISYTYRHSFATDALERGVGVAQVAELLGHTSTEMVMRHYSKLSQRVQHLREMVEKATADHTAGKIG